MRTNSTKALLSLFIHFKYPLKIFVLSSGILLEVLKGTDLIESIDSHHRNGAAVWNLNASLAEKAKVTSLQIELLHDHSKYSNV